MKEKRETGPYRPRTFKEFSEQYPESLDIDSLSHYFRLSLSNASLVADNLSGMIEETSYDNVDAMQRSLAEIDSNLETCLEVFKFTLKRLETLMDSRGHA